jgi:ERCC4-related helicase
VFTQKLGLSATPGKNIATIRKVVEVLRISKIEVRFEDDEDVKQYVHSRKFEVIVVEPPSQVVTVTKMLDKLLNTHLHTLKIRGGLPNWVGINSTPTAYFVHKAMNDYIETSGYDLMQHFSVAQTLLRVRECLRDNGIGVARKKLSEFMSKHTTKGGFALKVIQSQEFIDVWMSVIDANSTGKSPSKNTSEDLKINNPKLDMLDKILREHFNRARACGESSRAIVFSQLRDSVEEIVNVLHGSRPLVKAT